MYSGAIITPERTGVAEKKARRQQLSAAVPAHGSATVLPAPKPRTANVEIRGFPFHFSENGAQLIVEPSGRILWLSAASTVLAEASACIALEKGELSGRTRHTELLLRKLLEDAQAASGPVDQLVSRAANDIPELFLRARTCSGQKDGAIAITIRQLDRKVDDIPDLTRLYGLTPTEQQITAMMLQGRSVTEIAEELHKSVLTVRTHIKRTYVKLNVGTKEQLFSAVIRLMVD